MSLSPSQPEIATRAEWRPPSAVAESERPGHWAWLTEAGSLTGHLEASLGTPVEVELISEKGDDHGALRREVRLHSGGRPLLYAVSHIPASLLRRLDWMRSLGEQPLGARLFAVPGAQREDLNVARLTADDPLVLRACQGLDRPPGELWARRSRLVVQGQAMVVVECFLDSQPVGS